MNWLTDALVALPLALGVALGLGLPLALLALPRAEWHHRALVGALTVALGTAAQTAWMFALGTLGLLQPAPIMAGLALIGVAAWGLLMLKLRRAPKPTHLSKPPLTPFEKALLVGIGACVLGGWFATSFWPFMAYDTLWVYGYQARVYTLTGAIPASQGYYPQYLQLQYAFPQILLGAVNDHYARAVVVVLHVGSILAAYVLGSRVFDARRVGFFSAALWAFYPHVGQWVQMGDLEIPLAFTFTLSAALFLRAWCEPTHRRRYALLAGIVFGIAMWTKPTAGAFVWGVMLLVVWEFLRVRGSLRAFWPRFEVAALTGLACIPLGAVWYARNVLLGHPAVDLPHPSWLTLATRSGDLLGWPLLAAALLAIWAWLRPTVTVRQRALLTGGSALLLAGALPSMPWIDPSRINPPASYIALIEAALIALGAAVIGLGLWPARRHPALERLLLAYALALPYFLTWFYSYSYHYRLSFAIVPLLALPCAWLLAHWPRPRLNRALLRLSAAGLAVVLSLNGLIPLMSVVWDEDIALYWDGRFPDDEAKYWKTNPSLMILVTELRAFEARTGEPIRLMAPGEQQLRFFFPTRAMDNVGVPTRLSDLDGFTHYLYGNHAEWWYLDYAIDAKQTQIVGALGRRDIITRTAFHDEATFRYELYELNLDQRFETPEIHVRLTDEVVFGGFARLLGWAGSTHRIGAETLYFDLLWQPLQATTVDATLIFELAVIDTGEVVYTWPMQVMPHRHGSYRTSLWEVGETILDQRILRVDPAQDAALLPGQQYRLRLRLIDRQGEGVPLTINGQPAPFYEFGGLPLVYR